ncbi:MAG: hypothetical protein P8130_08850 [Deltaproteobacteria bacterium]
MDYDLCVNCGASRLSSNRRADLEQIRSFVNQGISIKELLKKYPNGFSVAANGSISRVIMATPHIRAVTLNFPAAPRKGGYLVVEMIDEL